MHHPHPTNVENRVWHAYELIQDPNNLPGVRNPVEKRRLVVINDNGTLMLNEAGRLTNLNNPPNDGMQGLTVLQLEQELRNFSTQLADLARAVDQLQASGQRNESAWQQMAELNRRVGQIYSAVQRFSAFPVIRHQAQQQQPQEVQQPPEEAVAGPGPTADGNNARANARNIPYESTLSPRPGTLYELWAKYKHGIGGRKAAKLFTDHERGRVKSVYTWRLIVWEEISLLVRAGDTYLVAIDRIYKAYGPTLPVTTIIKRIRDDRKTGRHPALRI